VQGGFFRLACGLLHAIRDERVEPGSFVDFIKMHHGLAFEENPLAVTAADWRPVRIVERAFDKIARGQQVFQTLLVLNADCATAEVVGQPHGGDVHFALRKYLLVREIGLVVGAGVESHPALFHPLAHRGCFGIAHLRRFVIQCRLTQPFLENSGAVQQVVRQNRVEHAHATFVEHAHNRLIAHQLARKPFSQRSRMLAHRCLVKGAHMT
jgi:hypothetical protein